MDIYRSDFKNNNIKLELFYAGYSTLDKSWCGNDINAPFSFLYYITDGKAQINTEFGEFILLPGHWYLLPAGCKFSYKCPDKMSKFYFHIKLCGEDNLDWLRGCKTPLILKKDLDFEQTLEFIKTGETLLGFTVKSLIYSTLSEILSKNNIRVQNLSLSPCVMRAVEFINNNLSAELTTEAIADAALVSKSTITKFFAREIQMSVQEYLYDVIFYKACKMLLENQKPIKTISLELGFCDQLYFSKKFKARYNVSPREYRKKYI
ncbi:MAG: helix-turn-helix transcriptional regulator [Clostridia bacterium]|nr:helix-turn-helix transcriptional regulator [Clostridia bacterium]